LIVIRAEEIEVPSQVYGCAEVIGAVSRASWPIDGVGVFVFIGWINPVAVGLSR